MPSAPSISRVGHSRLTKARQRHSPRAVNGSKKASVRNQRPKASATGGTLPSTHRAASMLLDISSGSNNSRTRASRGRLPAAISGPSKSKRNRDGGANRDDGLGTAASGKL